jgi:hypothetical protein
VFSNPDVIRAIKERFIPYAGDQWYLHRQEDEDGRFFWKVADQSHAKGQPRGVTRQGIYAATADGTWLASDVFRPSAERMLDLLKKARAAWEAAPKTPVQVSQTVVDWRFDRRPPEGGLILDVFTRIPLPQGDTWSPNNATARDHLWITREETAALLPAEWKNGTTYAVERNVAARLARFHLIDSVRGEPPSWNPEDVKALDLKLTVENAAAGRLKLTGTARLEADGGKRGYDSRVQGYLTVDRAANKVTRFDVLSWGEAWGEGTYTRGAPPGRFPLVVGASLAGNTPADRVPPQFTKHGPEYFRAAEGLR